MELKNVDFIGLSETWLSGYTLNSAIAWDSQQFFRIDRSRKKGGGLLVYITNALHPYCRQIGSPTMITEAIESIGLAYEQKHHRKLLIINYYRPPKGKRSAFLEYLDLIANTPEFNTHEVWIMGDVNMNIKISNRTTTTLFQHLKVQGLNNLFNHTTHPSTTGGSGLHLIFTNSSKIIKSGTLASLISDHYPIYAIRGTNNTRPTYKKMETRSYRNYCYENLANYIEGLTIDGC